MSDNSSSSSGITFSGLLQITFIVLKLCKVITWSWWWVMAPTWMGISIMLLIIGVIFLIAYSADHWKYKIRMKRQKTIDEMHQQIEEFRNSWPSVKDAVPKSKWQQRLDEMKKSQSKPK